MRVEQTGSEILRSNITKKTTLYSRRYAFTTSNRISLSLIGWNYDGVKSDSFAFSARVSALICILCRDLAVAVPSALERPRLSRSPPVSDSHRVVAL